MKTDSLIAQIRASSREMVRQLGFLDNRFESIGSISQCHALVEIDKHGSMNLKQLSEILTLEKSTTSRLIMQLADRGIFLMQPDENDRRNKIISLTKKGQALVNKIHREAKSQVQQALHLMTDEEKNIVAAGLTIYARALKQARIKKEKQ